MKFKEPLSHFQPNFAQSSLGFTNKDHSIIKNEMMGFFPSPNQSFDIFELVSRVSDVSYGPLDLFCCRSCCFSQYFILPTLVGADAMKAVTIGLRNLSSWQWTNGEPFSIVHPQLTNNLNSYDRNMDPCVFNFCGIFNTVSLTDLRIFDNCCHNVMSSFACFTKAFT